MSSFVAELLFENKESIPDGLYLTLMNTLKIAHDNEPVAQVNEVINNAVVSGNAVLIPNPPRVRENFFKVGIFRCGSVYFQIVSKTNYFLVIREVYDETGIGADGITGIKFNGFKMHKDKVKICHSISGSHITIKSSCNRPTGINANSLIPV